jgi:hypothetical protein
MQGALEESEDAALRLLLEQASSARQSVQRQIEAALSSAGKLVQARKISDALRLLRVLPPYVLRSPRVQMAIAALEDEQKMALFRMAGRAYANLDSELGTGHHLMQRVGRFRRLLPDRRGG